jgi:hypothetical protein
MPELYYFLSQGVLQGINYIFVAIGTRKYNYSKFHKYVQGLEEPGKWPFSIL